MRKYIPMSLDDIDDAVIFTVEEWMEIQSRDFTMGFNPDNGSAYWAIKPGDSPWNTQVSGYNTFTTPQEDATHVVWYSK